MDFTWFYPDKVSAAPGETVALFASASVSPCTLTINRVGAERVEVARIDSIAVGNHATPENADAKGCGWPKALTFDIGADWKTGYYDLVLTSPAGVACHHFVCVRKSSTDKKADAVIVLSTNTYFSYNYWGGSNSYASVEDLMAGKVSADESRAGAIGRLSRMRPLAQGMFAPPPGAPRLINLEPRAMHTFAVPGDPNWMAQHRPSPYDGAAGFLGKWEHRFAEWSERNGYPLDYLTDHDFERDPNALDGYKAALVVGHSEYWSGNQRAATEAFVDGGGKFIVLSGNTCYWKVRWEDDGQTLIAHKWRGEVDDPLWHDPATRKEATHLWSHEAFGAPEAGLIGLSFVYAGYHRLCMCVARGAAAYTVYDDLHWALEDTDLYYGDLLGAGVPLLGYENDGCPIRFGDDGLPKPNGGVGVPDNLQIIAMAPATLAESPRSPYPFLIPQEQPDVLAQAAFGEANDITKERLMRGHAVMASFTRGKGEVFNSGTTEWAHGLAAADPFVEKITENVLRRFGVGTSAG